MMTIHRSWLDAGADPCFQQAVPLNIMLPFAIKDLAGKELLAAGSLLDEATLNAVAAKGRQQQSEGRCLLKHGSIRSDLGEFMATPPYSFIFGGSDGIRTHLDQMGEIPIPLPILECLDHFKAHDYCTYRHSLIVFALTSLMAKRSDLMSAAERNVLLVGPTHDLGKWSIPLDILHKKTPLTRRERALLEFHPIAGYVLVSYYLGDHCHPAAHVALNHHERRDGSGYPRGICEVDPLVEMVATCDVYDALISSRPYRPSNYDNRTALEELTAIAEKGALHWCCVQTLIGLNRAGQPAPEQVAASLEKRGTPPADNNYALIADEEERHGPKAM
jgi:HD-GYP domain-containing protein (c-di-GMP phosphodiesterase class II)